MKRLTLYVAFCLLYVGCNSLVDGSSNTDSSSSDHVAVELISPTWHLESVTLSDGDVLTPGRENTKYMLQFKEDGSLEATNACNECSGTYEADAEGSLLIKVTCTEAACNVPAPYLGHGNELNNAVSYEIEEGQLIIYASHAGEQHILRYRAEE